MDLERQFEEAMREACEISADLGYYPVRFVEKMNRKGAVPYAKELVRSGELQNGLKRLYHLNRLDLSIEHLVARVPRYASLFTEEEKDAANWRLRQLQKQ